MPIGTIENIRAASANNGIVSRSSVRRHPDTGLVSNRVMTTATIDLDVIDAEEAFHRRTRCVCERHFDHAAVLGKRDLVTPR